MGNIIVKSPKDVIILKKKYFTKDKNYVATPTEHNGVYKVISDIGNEPWTIHLNNCPQLNGMDWIVVGNYENVNNIKYKLFSLVNKEVNVPSDFNIENITILEDTNIIFDSLNEVQEYLDNNDLYKGEYTFLPTFIKN